MRSWSPGGLYAHLAEAVRRLPARRRPGGADVLKGQGGVADAVAGGIFAAFLYWFGMPGGRQDMRWSG